MENNLILTGFVTGYTCLQEADATHGGKYQFMTLELRTDEPLPQTPVLYLTGALAVQLSSCQLTPQTQLRVYLRIYSRPYVDRDGVEHKSNEVTCWKIDVLDLDGNTIFTCRRS